MLNKSKGKIDKHKKEAKTSSINKYNKPNQTQNMYLYFLADLFITWLIDGLF